LLIALEKHRPYNGSRSYSNPSSKDQR